MSQKRFHIILVAGLLSFFIVFFKSWARKIERRLRGRYPTAIKSGLIKIHVVTSDGTGENAAYREVEKDIEDGLDVTLIVGGHSNGGRDGPYEASLRMRRFPKFVIPYAFVIDMTLGELGGKIFGNVAWIDEFWAKLEKTDFDKSFKKKFRVHRFYDLNKVTGKSVGHVEAASVPFVQDMIFENICNVIDGKLLK